MPGTQKKAGCGSYSDINSDYMLYKNAITPPVKTGGSRKLKSAISRKGGNIVDDSINAFKNLNISSLTSKIPFPKPGGCGSCETKSKKGGAIELAPFAASLAFLAARMSMDEKLNFSKLLNIKKPKTSRSTRSSRSTRQ